MNQMIEVCLSSLAKEKFVLLHKVTNGFTFFFTFNFYDRKMYKYFFNVGIKVIAGLVVNI